ncbi:MAG: c-type cytochrome, partial [Alphaproteobacteria bacterium]|nr:c-type cytochrome [Alphaproteobacteria bacterium]
MGLSRHQSGMRKWGARPVAGALLAFFLLGSGGALAQDAARIAKGEYLTRAGGCVACHTDLKGKGPELAGGHALKTPFGTYFSPNITPDRETGIGTWSDADFLRAMRQGLRPDGAHYYPVFPYPSYTGMTDEDIGAIKAYLFSRPAVKQANKAHQVGLPFSLRPLLAGWKLLFFKEGAFKPRPGMSPEINRGAYLVDHVAHCGECHTPRTF